MTEDKLSSVGLAGLTGWHQTLSHLRGGAATFLCILLGAFAAIGFAPFHITPALCVSLVGLIWMLDGARTVKRWGRAMFIRGWGFGFGFFLISMYWTVMPFLVDPEKHAIFLWMPLIALPGGMALIWGTACILAGSFWSASPSRVFIFAIFMALAELVRGSLFGGFPWNLPGTSWVPGGSMSQLASIGGIYWLTLLTFLILASPAALVDTRRSNAMLIRALPAVLCVVLLGFAWAWGTQRLTQETQFTDQSVVLMDAGVPQSEKFKRGGEPLLVRYIHLLRDTPSQAGDIVIWPEGALMRGLLQDPRALDLVVEFLGDRQLIAGSSRAAPTPDNQTVYFNSLAVLRTGAATADLLALYDKHRLVPFGELSAAEILPFGHFFADFLPSDMQRMVENGFRPGAGPTVLLPQTGVPPFIPLICYEGLFPAAVRTASPQRSAAEWIVVITNDAWFQMPLGLGPAQHYAQHRYRAIESGLPMARVATLGVTAMVDGFGRETERGLPAPGDPEGWRSAVARVALPARVPDTLYQRFGDTFYWITMVLCAGLAFLTWRR